MLVREVPARKLPHPSDGRPTLARPKPEVVVGYYARHMVLLVKVFLFLDGCTHNGLTHLVNTYLVVLKGWTAFDASWIWFTRDAVKFCLQACAGGLIDRTARKKAILAAVGAMKVVSGVIMVTTTAAAPQIIKGSLDGLITSLVVPATNALTLGCVGKAGFHRKHAQLNIMVKNAGVSLSVVTLGAVAWAIHPEISGVFYQFVVVGVLCLLCVLIMPGEDTVDHNVARGQSVRGGKDHWSTRSMRMGGLMSLVSYSDDESDEDEENLVNFETSPPDLVGRGFGEEEKEKQAGPMQPRSTTETNEEEEKMEEEETEEAVARGNEKKRTADLEEAETAKEESGEFTEYTDVLTLRDMFAQPTRRTSLFFLALTFFSFHLVNATVLPLLGQYIGLQESLHNDTRSVLPSMAGLIVLKEVGSFLTNWFLKSRLSKSLYRLILLIGCCVLLLRLVLISALVNVTDNLWSLGSTNILEGVAIGCLDLALALYSHLLSRQTGHYNLNMGIVSTFKTLGSALSIILGGALATYEDYNVGFPILTAMVVFPIFFSTRVYTPRLYGNALE